MSRPDALLRFDVFELDTAAGELRRHGDRIKLPPQPLRVLEQLVRQGGEIVTRADIRERIWSDSFVDFEQGLNFCIRQIREALGDSCRCATVYRNAASPRVPFPAACGNARYP